MKTIRVAAAIIRDSQGRFLLVRKRHTAIFMLPGGKIERDEDPVACLHREVREELGLQLSPAQIGFAAQMSAPAVHEDDATVAGTLYHVTLGDDQTPAAASEIDEIVWSEPGDSSRQIAWLAKDVIVRFAV